MEQDKRSGSYNHHNAMFQHARNVRKVVVFNYRQIVVEDRNIPGAIRRVKRADVFAHNRAEYIRAQLLIHGSEESSAEKVHQMKREKVKHQKCQTKAYKAQNCRKIRLFSRLGKVFHEE